MPPAEVQGEINKRSLAKLQDKGCRPCQFATKLVALFIYFCVICLAFSFSSLCLRSIYLS
jgi:hypothetical protein